jgi:CO/xanthine dehydrogenase FAD-binding subunit
MVHAQSPRTLTDAYAALAERPNELKVIAGGTDLMVLINAHQLRDQEFLDIWAIDELRGITVEGEFIRIGALTTYTHIIRSSLVQQYAPSLTAASRTIGAIQIQNRGTLGGNIVNASPAADSLPVLAAYDAQFELGSARGTRMVSVNEFYTGYRKTVLEPDELVLAVRLPKLADSERDFFWKVGTRRAQAISKTVVAARLKANNGVIESIAIGIGSVAPTVIRARLTEDLLNGSRVTSDRIQEARHSIGAEISPITDLRSNEHYRRVVSGNVLAKLLRQLIQ